MQEITEDRVIQMWRAGFSLEKISKEYAKYQKERGKRITIEQAQQFVEPIVFKYQVETMKN